MTRKPAHSLRARRAAAVVLAVLLLAAGPSVAAAAEPKERPASAAIDALQSDFKAIGEQTREDPAAPIDAFDVGPPASDEAGRMHQVMRQFLNSMFKVRNAYLAELSAMGWERILDGDRLRADTGMVESRRLIGLARAAAVRAEADSVVAFNGFAAMVQAAPLLAANKRDMIAGFNDSKARGLADMRGSWALESQTMDEFEAMVELLGRTQWDVQDAQILFHADADVEAFNGHFDRINALTEELAARQQGNIERAQEKLDQPRQ